MGVKSCKPRADLDHLVRGLSDLTIRIMLSEKHVGCHCRLDLVKAEAERRRMDATPAMLLDRYRDYAPAPI